MKNKYKLFLLIVITFFTSLGWAACPDAPTPRLNIKFNYGKKNYINNKSNDQFPQKPHKNVRGLTVTDLQRKTSGDTEIRQVAPSAYCVSLERLNVQIGYPKVDIYIDKKYRPESCNYKVIKEHENYHARVQLEGLKFFEPKIKEAYKIALEKVKPIETGSKESANQAASRLIQQIESEVAPLINYVQQRLVEENMVIDTDDSYAEESKKCKNW